MNIIRHTIDQRMELTALIVISLKYDPNIGGPKVWKIKY